MTVRELGNAIFDWFTDSWITVIFFFVDMYEKISNGDFLDITLWQLGFLLILWFVGMPLAAVAWVALRGWR